MPEFSAILAALAVAGGFGALIGILVGGRARQPIAVVGDQPTASPEPRVPLLARGRELVPKGYLGMLDHRLALAGRPAAWTIDKILIAKPLAAAAGILFAIWWVSLDPAMIRVIFAAAVVIVSFFVPELLLWSRGKERQEQIQNALADTLDQMTIAVEAGLGFEGAMAKAATNGKGALAEELIRTLQDMSIGQARKDAYQSLADRTSSTELRRFTRSVIQADTYGIAIADVLRVQAAEMRLRRRQRAEEKAMKVPVKVLFPLIFCILPVLFIVLLTPAVLSIVKAFSL
ncbi:type II secretion system F family protein [Cryobacterium frigoriphilum]|uniref:Type II secretion system F family protein n=1 Tax=Cryobacterium frigoriphilum TaxID=1259150 RepID=A0A4R9AB18_9MICO|nr:type II secretion system F family protein [Cryobacterium frigoriphilum]TFD55167.1 type II secretion system F family protein [Cryobacterium frigoriphilum]